MCKLFTNVLTKRLEKIRYHPGRRNESADGLSRKPHPTATNEFTAIGDERIADILQVTALPCDLHQTLLKGNDPGHHRSNVRHIGKCNVVGHTQ